MADDLRYAVDCGCGKSLAVSASHAGSQIQCACGAVVSVPRLSQLRRSQGQDALECGIRDRIVRLIREGALPSATVCAASAAPTNDVMLFDVLCETSYVKGSRKWGIALLLLGFIMPCAWFFWLLGIDLMRDRTERVGRDVVLTVPLRVAGERQSRLRRRTTQRRLRQLLKTETEYQRLFAEYPGARIYPH